MSAAPVASASLYVGDLHPDVTEPMLFEVFSQVGPVASIRVCRDAIARRSLGYAYVNFHNIVDAERALDTLNYTEIHGQPCRVMWKQRDPSMRKTGVGNVFIKNLDKTIDNRVLNDTFSAFGNIISCKVAIDDMGVSKGHGYVQYETQEEADRAIAKVNGMLICGAKVFVGAFIPKTEREKLINAENTFTNLYVKNLDAAVDDSKLKEMFSEFGTITSGVVMRKEDGTSKCFGFINFEKHEMAREAVANMHSKQLGEKILYVAKAEKKKRREIRLKREREHQRAEKALKYQGVNLYVKNLDDSVDNDKLRQAFAPFGTITSAKVVADEKNISRGFGFVCFNTPEEATKAVTAMNGTMFISKPLYVALHQTKEIRRAQLQAQFAQRQKMTMRVPMQPMPPGMPGMPVYFPPGAAGPVQRPGMFYFPQAVGPSGPQQQQRWGPGPRAMAMPPGGARQPRNRRQMQQGQPGQMMAPGAPGAGQPQRRGPQTFKYAPNVRNRDAAALQHMGNAPNPVAMASVPMGMANELSPGTLANMAPEAAKQLLGERLYAFVYASKPDLAGKITGMLLELDNTEILHLIESPEALQSKIAEAMVALDQARTQDSPAPQ